MLIKETPDFLRDQKIHEMLGETWRAGRETGRREIAKEQGERPTIRQLACLMMAQGLLASEFDDTFEKVAERAVAQADAVLKAEAESRK
jgi:hypothetical protein